MKWNLAQLLRAGLAGAALAAALAVAPAHAASDRPLFMSVGAAARAPVGWREFCAQYAPECETPAMPARDVVLTTQAWNDLLRIHQWVNEAIKHQPRRRMSDMGADRKSVARSEIFSI